MRFSDAVYEGVARKSRVAALDEDVASSFSSRQSSTDFSDTSSSGSGKRRRNSRRRGRRKVDTQSDNSNEINDSFEENSSQHSWSEDCNDSRELVAALEPCTNSILPSNKFSCALRDLNSGQSSPAGVFSNPVCYCCGQIGHVAFSCPTKRTTNYCYGCGTPGVTKRNCPNCLGQLKRFQTFFFISSILRTFERCSAQGEGGGIRRNAKKKFFFFLLFIFFITLFVIFGQSTVI